jgi:hypothetical protein
VWREFDWQATVPSTASIQFSAQSGPNAAGLLPSAPVVIGTATTTTPNIATGNFSVALIDTSTGGGTSGTAPFNTATPPVHSDALLRITIAMNPTTSSPSETPTLIEWRVQSDCPPAE